MKYTVATLVLVFLWAHVLVAKPLSQSIYEDLKNKKCFDANKGEIQDLQSLCGKASSAHSLSKNFDLVSENLVFQELAQGELAAVECSAQKKKSLLSQPKALEKFAEATCNQLSEIRLAKKSLQQISAEIKSLNLMNDRTLRVVPEDEFKKREAEIQRLTKIEELNQAYLDSIYSNDTLLRSSRTKSFVEDHLRKGLIFKTDEDLKKVCADLKAELPQILREDLKDLKASQSQLNDLIRSKKPNDNLKEQLWSSSSAVKLREKIIREQPDLQNSLVCRMEARYGEGAKIRDGLIHISTLALGAGVAGTGRLVTELFAQRSAQGIALARTAVAVEAATDISIAGYQISKECRDQLAQVQGESCEYKEQDIQGEVSKNQCVISAGLGMVTLGLSSLGVKSAFAQKAQPLKEVDSALEMKSFITSEVRDNPQLAIWKLRQEGKLTEAQAVESIYIDKLNKMDFKITGEVGFGTHVPKYVEFSDGTKGIWKPSSNPYRSQLIGREIAAYKIDQKLGLGQVPMTVERSVDGKAGVMQIMIRDADKVTYKESPENFAFLDTLIGNEERRFSSNIISAKGKPVAIDHDRAFQANPVRDFEYRASDINHRMRYADNPQDLSEALQESKNILPSKQVYQKLKNTDEKEWYRLLSKDLNGAQINSFLRNRKTVLKNIDDLRQKYGDQIFPDGAMTSIMKTKSK